MLCNLKKRSQIFRIKFLSEKCHEKINYMQICNASIFCINCFLGLTEQRNKRPPVLTKITRVLLVPHPPQETSRGLQCLQWPSLGVLSAKKHDSSKVQSLAMKVYKPCVVFLYLKSLTLTVHSEPSKILL